MSSISRHDITASGHGKGVEGMLVLTELRLLFLPDISHGSATASYLEFHTVQARERDAMGVLRFLLCWFCLEDRKASVGRVPLFVYLFLV